MCVSASEFCVEFGNRLYWAKFDLSKVDEEQRSVIQSDAPEDRMLNENGARRKALESVCSLKLLAALQSALLNESATLFRRKYYQNGSHAGFILYMTDAAQNEQFVDDLRGAMRNSKGPGNFRNLFMYAPGGKKDGLQLIPISEVAAKDDFGAIKNISRDDLLAALRIPPQLMGIVPQNAGGFGSIRKAAEIWAVNELEPIQARLTQGNEWLGEEVVRFKPFEVAVAKE